MLNTVVSIILYTTLVINPVNPAVINTAGQAGTLVEQNKIQLASEKMDLSYRYPVESVSDGFRENILINLYHFSRIGADNDYNGVGDIKPQEKVPASFIIMLKPGEVFAFHDKINKEYEKDKVIAPKSGYGAKDGYLLISGLYGNGVCHLATLMYKTAEKANIEVNAPTRHDFASIPGFTREEGTAISYGNCPERQNLYVKNNKPYPVELRFDLSGSDLIFTINMVV